MRKEEEKKERIEEKEKEGCNTTETPKDQASKLVFIRKVVVLLYYTLNSRRTKVSFPVNISYLKGVFANIKGGIGLRRQIFYGDCY